VFTAAFLAPILVEIVAGAGSAVVVGNVVQPISFGALRNAIVGAVGGLVCAWITARTPGLEQYVEGELSAELLAGVGAAGLVGGALAITIAGLVRNQTAN
jgi:uncharacterized membrane protein YeaQ/YmgE (transglycosylase-associated protein family)